MKNVIPLQHAWLQVPVRIRSFLLRAALVFIIWKLLYHLLLFPVRFPDKQLTALTAGTTAFIYKNMLGEKQVIFREETHGGNKSSIIYVRNTRAIGIADSCNGLELYILYIAFLFCIPVKWKRRLFFILLGSSLIFISNGFRCVGLAWLFLHNYSWANFAHHYLFKMVIYGMIFYLWVLYSKRMLSYDYNNEV